MPVEWPCWKRMLRKPHPPHEFEQTVNTNSIEEGASRFKIVDARCPGYEEDDD